MIFICARLVELHCSDCGERSYVTGADGWVELADVNAAEHEHQLTHLIQAHKEREALG